jgi:predicted GTPase
MIDIAHLCNRRDRSKVENIFLLGKSGAGKSALVNTVIKVISGKYTPKAKVGAGTTQSKTLNLERYLNY